MNDVIDGTKPLPAVAEAMVEAERNRPEVEPQQEPKVPRIRMSSTKTGVTIFLPERFREQFRKRGVDMTAHPNANGTVRVQLVPTPKSVKGKKVRPGKAVTLYGKEGFYVQFTPSRVKGLNGTMFGATDATKVSAAGTHLTFWVEPKSQPRTAPVEAPAAVAEPEVQGPTLVYVIMCNDSTEGVVKSLQYAKGYCDASNDMAKRVQERHGGARPRWHYHTFVLREADNGDE